MSHHRTIVQTLDSTRPPDVRAEATAQSEAWEIGAFSASFREVCEGTFHSERHYLQMAITLSEPIYSQFVPQASTRWVRNGRCIFVPAGQQVQCRVSPGKQHLFACLVTPALLDTGNEIEIDWNDIDPDAASDVQSPCAQMILNRILDELLCPSFSGSFYIESALNFLGHELARCLIPHRKREVADEVGLTPRQMALVRERVEAMGMRPPSLAELAELVSLRPGVLSERFQRSSARTLRAYLAETKMQKARSLIMRGELQMKQIAYLSGFESAAAFATAFRKQFGFPPSEYSRRAIH